MLEIDEVVTTDRLTAVRLQAGPLPPGMRVVRPPAQAEAGRWTIFQDNRLVFEPIVPLASQFTLQIPAIDAPVDRLPRGDRGIHYSLYRSLVTPNLRR